MTVCGSLLFAASDDPQIRVFELIFGERDEETGAEVKVNFIGGMDRNATDKSAFVTVKDRQSFSLQNCFWKSYETN